LLVLRKQQLIVGTNDSPLAVKKKVDAASVSSTKAFHTTGLALQLEVPTAVATSILGQKVGEKCWNFGLDGRLEAVVANIQREKMAASIQLEVVVEASQRLPSCKRPSP
jgi:hypothetical protein